MKRLIFTEQQREKLYQAKRILAQLEEEVMDQFESEEEQEEYMDDVSTLSVAHSYVEELLD